MRTINVNKKKNCFALKQFLQHVDLFLLLLGKRGWGGDLLGKPGSK